MRELYLGFARRHQANYFSREDWTGRNALRLRAKLDFRRTLFYLFASLQRDIAAYERTKSRIALGARPDCLSEVASQTAPDLNWITFLFDRQQDGFLAIRADSHLGAVDAEFLG